MTPVTPHPFSLKIPHRPVCQNLPNGCTAYLFPIADTQLVRIDFMFGGGQWLQSQTLQARFAFKSLRDGTRSFSAEQIEQQLDYYGATLEATANLAYGVVTLRCLHKFLPQLLTVMRSLLTEPLYDAQHLDIALAQARMAWQINHQKVETLGKELLYEHLFGSQHPMGRNIHFDDYDKINSEVLQDYHRRYFHAANCRLLLTGAFRPENVEAVAACLPVQADAVPVVFTAKPVPSSPHLSSSLSSSFHLSSSLSSSSHPSSSLSSSSHSSSCISPLSGEVPSPLFTLHPDFETVQAAVRMGCLLPEASHPDMPLVRLVATILGGYFGSRLMTNIREEKGYTYDIHNTIYNIPFGNALVIKTETTNESAQAVLQEIHHELQLLIDQPIEETELQNVLNYMTGNQSRHYELNFEFPQVFMTLLSLNRTLDDIVEDSRKQHAATPRLLQDMAARYFAPHRFISAVVS